MIHLHKRFVAAVQPYKSALSIGGSGSQALIGCTREGCYWTETRQFPAFAPDQVRAALKFPDVRSISPMKTGGPILRASDPS